MSSPYEGWAICELMGHRKLAGWASEQEIAGQAFLRLDVHDTDSAVTTQFYSPAAVYCITPTTEDIARKVGAQARPRPVTRYEIEPPRAAFSVIDDDHIHGEEGDDAADPF